MKEEERRVARSQAEREAWSQARCVQHDGADEWVFVDSDDYDDYE